VAKPKATDSILPDYPNEAHFKRHLVARARSLGWLVYHHPDSRHAYAAGFPDLVMVRGQVLYFIECKSNEGRFTPEQSDWIDALQEARQHVDIWRPAHHHRIEAVLSTGWQED
jgi:hypothetical protein